MAKCSHCGKFIMFGGKKQGELRFCSDACHQQGFLAPLAERFAPEVIEQQVRQIHQQSCPVCGGDGPADINTSRTTASILIMTSRKDSPRLSCARCGKGSINKGIASTALFGWWGFPFGFIFTPWQLFKGVKSLSNLPDASQPSEKLQRLVKLQVAGSLADGN